jgi:copper ion binding protein
MKNITLNVKGMHCKSCVMLIEEGVSDLNGVAKVKASLEKNKVDITFDESKVGEVAIRKAIVAEGYSVL